MKMSNIVISLVVLGVLGAGGFLYTRQAKTIPVTENATAMTTPATPELVTQSETSAAPVQKNTTEPPMQSPVSEGQIAQVRQS